MQVSRPLFLSKVKPEITAKTTQAPKPQLQSTVMLFSWYFSRKGQLDSEIFIPLMLSLSLTPVRKHANEDDFAFAVPVSEGTTTPNVRLPLVCRDAGSV